jgi:hypothetical protein
VGWVVGEQVRIISQLDADCGERGPDLVQVVRDQCAGVRVDGKPAVMVGLGVLTNAAAAANDVVERKVDQGAIQVGRVGLESTTSGL